MLSGKYLSIDKDREVTCIELYPDDERYKDDLMCLIKIIYKWTEGKKVFVNFLGEIKDEEKEYIIAQKPYGKRRIRWDLWVKREWIKNTKSIDEDDFCMFFFDDEYTWEMYLSNNKITCFSVYKEAQLYLVASFGEVDPPALYFRNDNPIIDEIINVFANNGYRIIRSSHWLL